MPRRPHPRGGAANLVLRPASEFSTVAGDLAANLEDVAAHARLDEAPPILERLETVVRELLGQVDELSVKALHGGGKGRP